MDSDNHGFSVDTAGGRSHRRGSPRHGHRRFRLLGDRRSGRLPGQPQRGGGDGYWREFRDRAERDSSAEALPCAAAVGVGPEEYRSLLRLHARAGAHALPPQGDRPEGWPLADDHRPRPHSHGHVDLALAGSAASVSLQVTAQRLYTPFM